MVKGSVHGEGRLCGEGGPVWQGACVVGGMHGRGMHGKGACITGSMHGRGVYGSMNGRRGDMHGRGACMVGDTTTVADGTHHIVMHSCLLVSLVSLIKSFTTQQTFFSK